MLSLPISAFLNLLGGSPWELAVVFGAILLLFGADSLPKAIRTLGQWSAKLRMITRELQRELEEAGEPIEKARRDWEQECSEFAVSQAQGSAIPEEESDVQTQAQAEEGPENPST